VKARGFTLIEMLVALAVTALLGVMLLGLFSRIDRNVEAVRDVGRRTTELRALFRLVRQDLQAMLAQPPSAAPMSGRAARYGGLDLDQFSFVIRTPAVFGAGSPLQQVSYRAQDAGQEGVAVNRMVQPLQSAGTGAARTELVKGVSGFRVRYLTETGQWSERWPARGSRAGELPRALRIEVEMQKGDVWHSTFAIPLARRVAG
jgi:general secretion pathway protein J